MRIQINLSPKLNQQLKIYKAQHNLHNLQIALIKILEEKFTDQK